MSDNSVPNHAVLGGAVTQSMKDQRFAREVAKARNEGFHEGEAKGRQEIIDWLENAYIKDPGRPDRGTPKAEAILEVARDAALYFKNLTRGTKR